MMSRIGDQVREARSKQGLSQKQLARKVGASEKYIQEVESGNKIINQEMLDKIIKAVDAQISDSLMLEEYMETETVTVKAAAVSKMVKPVPKKSEDKLQPEIQEIWSGALSGVLADVPVFEYNLNKKIQIKQLPIISKKVEGHPQDKVLYLKIMDNDMSGFRIVKDDLAFCVLTHEVENNSICLIEYQGENCIKQIKKLDTNKLLLVSNSGVTRTQTVSIKEVKVLAKLLKVEFGI
jgi:transcriptional regulator with XRE-family HTH domain